MSEQPSEADTGGTRGFVTTGVALLLIATLCLGTLTPTVDGISVTQVQETSEVTVVDVTPYNDTSTQTQTLLREHRQTVKSTGQVQLVDQSTIESVQTPQLIQLEDEYYLIESDTVHNSSSFAIIKLFVGIMLTPVGVLFTASPILKSVSDSA